MDPTYTQQDMHAAYDQGRRAPRASGGVANAVAVAAIIIMVAIMAATYIGYNPFRASVAVQEVAPTAAPQPTRAPVAAPIVPQQIIVQTVPQGQVAQPISIPVAPAPPLSADSPAPVEPAPRPLVIVVGKTHDGTRNVITGSGACKAGGNAIKRCGK